MKKTVIKILAVALCLCTCMAAISLSACAKCAHTESDWIVEVEATCTERGLKNKVCLNCFTIIETETISKIEHDGEWQTISQTTCSDKGVKQNVCKNCETVLAVEVLDKSAHTESDWIVEVEATCTERGLKNKVCLNCFTIIETETISKTEHDGEWQTISQTTCSDKGVKQNVCKNCETVLAVEVLDKSAHTESDWIVEVEATCTERGLKNKVCLNCFTIIETETISKTEHEFTDYISDNNATYDNDGTKTATCNRDNCSATDTVTDDGTKLISHIEFKTLDLENKNIFANNAEEFSFLEEIETFGYSKFNVASDKYGKEEYLIKIVPLNFGDNTFYVFESIDGDIVNTYTVVLRRRLMYSVYFDACGGTAIESQMIEESFTASMPTEETERAGYTFDGWDFDFATPITQDITVNAKWTANTDTPYTVEYYFENSEDSNYTIDNALTEELTGTTDTTATVTPKTFEHFTFNNYKSNTSGNIDGNGNTVLKLYYTRNYYNCKIYTVKFSLTTIVYGEEVTCGVKDYGSFDDKNIVQDLEELVITIREGQSFASLGISELPIVDPIEDEKTGEMDGTNGSYAFSGYWKYSNAHNGETKTYKVQLDTIFNAENFPGVGDDGVITLIPQCYALWTPFF